MTSIDTRFDDAELPLARKASRMGRLIHRYYMAASQAHGSAAGNILRGQGRVLALLKNKPETTQRELQFVLDMRQQSLSELLAKLEEKGYVTRSKSPDDGRVTIVRLTDEGAAAAPDPDAMAQSADALDCLTGEDRTKFEEYVDLVTESLTTKLKALGIDPMAPHPGPKHHRGGCGPQGRGGRGAGPHDPHDPHGHRVPREAFGGPEKHAADKPREGGPERLDAMFEHARRASDDKKLM